MCFGVGAGFALGRTERWAFPDRQHHRFSEANERRSLLAGCQYVLLNLWSCSGIRACSCHGLQHNKRGGPVYFETRKFAKDSASTQNNRRGTLSAVPIRSEEAVHERAASDPKSFAFENNSPAVAALADLARQSGRRGLSRRWVQRELNVHWAKGGAGGGPGVLLGLALFIFSGRRRRLGA